MRFLACLERCSWPAAGRALAAAAALLTFTACASSPAGRGPERDPRPRTAFYGVAGNHFVKVDPESGALAIVSTSQDLRDVGALTYDSDGGVFYAIADATSDPELLRIDPATGEVAAIGHLDLPHFDVLWAEGLAFEARGGALYVTAASPRKTNRLARGGFSTFASDHLMTVDAASGRTLGWTALRGTPQNELDALVAFGGKLYGVDAVASASTVFALDPVTGETSPTGKRFPAVVEDLAFDPATRRLLAIAEDRPALLAMAWSDGEVRELAAAERPAELGGAPLAALACACPPEEGILLDDFESGDLSTWEAGRDGGP